MFHKAALLSGPPGIGKTTTAVLACKVNIAPATPLHYQLDLFLSFSLFLLSLSFPSLSLSVLQELGYSYTELNASATRSKKSLQQFVTDSLSSHSMDSFITGGKGPHKPPPVHASWPLQFFLIIGRLNVIEILNFIFNFCRCPATPCAHNG